MSDSDLLKRLREKQPEAVRYLTQYYLPSVWRFVYVRANGDEHLAEDIVSETALALIRAAADEAEIDSPSAWMRSVAYKKLMDHYRAAARVKHLIGQVTTTHEVAEQTDAATQHVEQERREEVRRIMDALSEQHRMALEWKYIEKLSVRDIADRWETTEKAVESILFRARREFRRQHRKETEDDAPEPDRESSQGERETITDERQSLKVEN